MGGEVPIHSVRLPGLVAHQEVILGAPGQFLTHPPRHDLARRVRARASCSRSSGSTGLPPGLTVGLDALL